MDGVHKFRQIQFNHNTCESQDVCNRNRSHIGGAKKVLPTKLGCSDLITTYLSSVLGSTWEDLTVRDRPGTR